MTVSEQRQKAAAVIAPKVDLAVSSVDNILNGGVSFSREKLRIVRREAKKMGIPFALRYKTSGRKRAKRKTNGKAALSTIIREIVGQQKYPCGCSEAASIKDDGRALCDCNRVWHQQWIELTGKIAR